MGYTQGYFPQPIKAILVLKPESVERAEAHFTSLGFHIHIEARYFGNRYSQQTIQEYPVDGRKMTDTSESPQCNCSLTPHSAPSSPSKSPTSRSVSISSKLATVFPQKSSTLKMPSSTTSFLLFLWAPPLSYLVHSVKCIIKISQIFCHFPSKPIITLLFLC